MIARYKLSAEAEWIPAWISTSQSRVSKRDPMVKTPSMLWAVFSNTRSPLSKPTPCLAPIWIWPSERPCHGWYRKTGKIQSCQQFPEGPRSASDMSETELSKTSLTLTNWLFLNDLNFTHFLSVPRDMGLWSARRLREALETAAKSTGSKKQGPPIPEDHRRDQDPSRFWAWKPHVKMLIPPKQLSVLYKFWTWCMRFTFKIQKSTVDFPIKSNYL